MQSLLDPLHLRNTTLIHAQIWLSPFQLLKFTTSKVFTTAHTNMEQVSIDIDLVIVMPGQIPSAYQLPPHRMTFLRLQ